MRRLVAQLGRRRTCTGGRPQRALVDEARCSPGRRVGAGVEAGAGVRRRVVMPPTPISVRSGPTRPRSSRSTSSERAVSGRAGEPAGADLARPWRPGSRRPSRRDRRVGGDDAVEAERERPGRRREHVVVGEVGRDLHQQRHAAVGRPSSAAVAHGARAAARSFSTACRLRRPGVLGELTLTTR